MTHAIGLREKATTPITLPSVPDFFFTTAQSRIEPPAYELTGILQLPYVLWAYDRTTGQALMIANRSEANVSRAFEAGDQELIEGGLSVYIDVLARKQAEQELRRAMRAAEQADEAKAAFLATLSHELRTPLNAIIGLADILSAKRPSALTPERSVAYATEIAGSGRHLLRLINDILDYSGIARGHLAIQPEWIRLEHAVGAAVRAAHGMAAERGVTLSMSPIDPAFGLLVDLGPLPPDPRQPDRQCGQVHTAGGAGHRRSRGRSGQIDPHPGQGHRDRNAAGGDRDRDGAVPPARERLDPQNGGHRIGAADHKRPRRSPWRLPSRSRASRAAARPCASCFPQPWAAPESRSAGRRSAERPPRR